MPVSYTHLEKRRAHFRTVPLGGFEEEEVLCYLWDIVKFLEAGPGRMGQLEKQLRRRVRVEMRRYFARRRRRNVNVLVSALALAACMIGIFTFLIGIDIVSGDSMYPSLHNGDLVLYSRPLGNGIKRNEIVIFHKNGENFIKRVAGLPWDQVQISESGGRVEVNGAEVLVNDVTLANPAERENEDQMGQSMAVMKDQYLVLGDNRGVSIDSRDSQIGTVPRENILGKVIMIVRTRE